MDRWPIIGGAARRGGKAVNHLLYREAGVAAVVDGQVAVKLSPSVFSGGAYAFDRKLTAELKRLAAPGRDFVDAGAHMGMASLVYAAFAGAGTRIVALEPNPHAFPLLVENSRVNAMRIECFPLALGAEVGAVNFYADGTNPNASLSEDAPKRYWYWETREKPAMKALPATMTTLDRFCAALGLSPGLIKLDVEGAELPALKGAAETLRKHRPAILLETHVFAWQSFGYDRQALEDEIAVHGYRICDGLGQPFHGPLGSGPERDNNHFLLLPA
jgi:FkbM family methyltransferase